MAFERAEHWQIYDEAGRRKYLTPRERARFLRAADQLPAAARAFCYTLSFTGCRVSEALEARREYLDVDGRRLRLRTLKRRKVIYRWVPLPDPLVPMLAKLQTLDAHPLWTMHRATAWRIVKRTMEAAEIQGPMACPRGCRHGFGILAATANVPPNLIQRWMGHATGATTAIYLDAVGSEEREFAARMW